MMKRSLLAGLVLMVGWAHTATATSLVLPPVNTLTTTVYGDISVQSLQLDAACSSAGDPRCLPSGPFNVSSATGQIDPQIVIYQGATGNNNYPVPLNTDLALAGVDNPFRAPGGGDTTFQMSSLNEPGTGNVVNTSPEFTGDIIGRWDANLGTLATYLGTNNLVFLFGNNQTGNDVGQAQNLWAQIRIYDENGVLQNCFELHSLSLGAGCVDTGADPNPATTGGSEGVGDYVPVVGDFCVDAITGVAYNFGANNAGACNAGDYFITNNIGQSFAEFAAFNALLDAIVHDPTKAGWSMSVNVKLTNLTDGEEVLWICDQCTFERTRVPAPAAVLLLGSGLLGTALLGWRRSRRT